MRKLALLFTAAAIIVSVLAVAAFVDYLEAARTNLIARCEKDGGELRTETGLFVETYECVKP